MVLLGTSGTSVRIILLSCSRTPYQHAKTRHTVNGNPASVTLPTQVAPGDYLVHHEIIALHLAVTLGRAEPSSIHPARKSASVAPKRAPSTNLSLSH
jgi:Auxiliary Activity family 9 (formerly GH61)